MSNASNKKHGLGKGISSLMDDYSFEAVFKTPLDSEASEIEGGKLMLLEINRVHPNPHQPRKQFDQDTLDELAESIKTQGILQPLLVEKISDDDPRQAANLMRKLSEATGMNLGPAMEEALRRMERGEDPEAIESEMGDLLESEEPFLFDGGSGKKSTRKPRPRVDETLYDL